MTSAACSQHVSLHERSQGVERFILDAGDLSLACALIHSAETPGRGTESCLGGFLDSQLLCSPLFFLSWSVSVSDVTTQIISDQAHYRDPIIESGLP